ncbi:MAG: hypothetical protein KAF27_04810, partial [Porphyrobacter sp.]|nr:hypothetical protein [Porphyrobacter sp.]
MNDAPSDAVLVRGALAGDRQGLSAPLPAPLAAPPPDTGLPGEDRGPPPARRGHRVRAPRPPPPPGPPGPP